MKKLILALLAIALTAPDAFAWGRRRAVYSSCSQTVTRSVTFEATPVDGLDEVNAARAARGLRPFIRDESLSAGAMEIIKYRAKLGIIGHAFGPNPYRAGDTVAIDHQFAPGCASAGAEGIPMHPTQGWHTCCTFEGYTRAGAAYAIRPDGLRIMHLYVK